MSEAMIRTESLTKCYANVQAVTELNLDVKEGTLFGFIGPNGAGKTTTIRVLCGLLKPTSGAAFINGLDVTRHPREIKRIVGYLPEIFGVYDRMRVWEYLDFFGAAYRIPRSDRGDMIERTLKLTNAYYMRDYFLGSLSKGMRQRVGIAKTLVHDPPVLILDEPTSGLDPYARIEIRQLLRQLRKIGKTVLISSHILPELSAVCDEVGIIEKSRLLASGPVEKILEQVRQTRPVQIQFLERADEAAEVIKRFKGVQNLQTVENVVRLEFQGDDRQASILLKLLLDKGFDVVWMREQEADLEEVFIRVTGKEREARRERERGRGE